LTRQSSRTSRELEAGRKRKKGRREEEEMWVPKG